MRPEGVPLHAIDILVTRPEACDACRGVILTGVVSRIYLCESHLNALKQEPSVQIETCGRPECPNCKGKKEKVH